MKYIDLLGKHLKSDDVIDVLECDDLEVIYSFDRLHENQPDVYWATSRAEGIQMRFNADQILDTLFFYIQPDEGFSPCDPESLGVPVFDSRDSAREYASRSSLSVTEGEVDFLGVHRKWIKIDFGSHLHHSEYRDEKLHRMSAFLPLKAQQESGEQSATRPDSK
ncbi:MAG: hypothetical protein ABL994_05385 [Verrucomicrobiales bacterium]